MPPPPHEPPTRDDDEDGIVQPRRRRNSADIPTRELHSFARKPRPLIVNRYILLGQLGSGGTSLVYKAYDPELDRKVALKLLQTRPDPNNKARLRLMREAQAMAKLTHPNVVTVHDVAGYGEMDLGLDPGAAAPDTFEIPPRGVFIVMELVEGGDLRRWLNRRHRPWREVLQTMIAAGRGLAAAHEVGIVHRDFKPGNVLIGDGRVLVTDFGLARAASSSAASDVPEVEGDPTTSFDEIADGNLTKTGAVLGTPPYMSPEQHRGDGSDPRTDQFGFGVTLYEALLGVRPFSGSVGEMRRAKDRAQWRPIPSGSKIPARVVAVIERAMQPRPEDRYESMNALLEALERAARPRIPRSMALGTALGAVVLAVPLTVMLLPSEDDPCTAGEDHVQRVWSAERQSQVQAAFTASKAPYAKSASHRVQTLIDLWTDDWLEAYRDACEATHVRHEQSQDALDLRVACLGRHLRELEAMTDLMIEQDPRVIENSVVSVQSLGNLRACADLAALAARTDPPANPRARARVDEGYDQLAEARARELTGRYEDAEAIGRKVSDEALAVEYRPLHAAAELQIARVQSLMGEHAESEQHLLAAILSAERSRDEPTAADAWIHLVWVVGVEQNRPGDALRWIQFAEVALDRLGPDPLRQAALDHNRAGVYYRLERYDEALEHYQRAYDVQHEAYGEQHPLVAQTVNHMGNVLIMQGRYALARDKCEQALAIRRETLGPKHPRVAAPLNNLAELLSRQGDFRGALSYAEQALAIVQGSGRPEEVIAWILVARQHDKLHEPAAELEARLRVLALLDAHPGFDQSSRAEQIERVAALREVTRPSPSEPSRSPAAAP